MVKFYNNISVISNRIKALNLLIEIVCFYIKNVKTAVRKPHRSSEKIYYAF